MVVAIVTKKCRANWIRKDEKIGVSFHRYDHKLWHIWKKLLEKKSNLHTSQISHGPGKRDAWLRGLGLSSDYILPKSSAVCSEHFDPSDYTYIVDASIANDWVGLNANTSNGQTLSTASKPKRRRLHMNAVPCAATKTTARFAMTANQEIDLFAPETSTTSPTRWPVECEIANVFTSVSRPLTPPPNVMSHGTMTSPSLMNDALTSLLRWHDEIAAKRAARSRKRLDWLIAFVATKIAVTDNAWTNWHFFADSELRMWREIYEKT